MTNRGWEEDLHDIGMHDAQTLIRKNKEYGNSWAKRGGQGAFFVTARKWDRIENQVKPFGYDIFEAIRKDKVRVDGLMDDIQDLRRYLMLVEAEVISWGHTAERKPTTEQDSPFGFDANLDCQNEQPKRIVPRAAE